MAMTVQRALWIVPALMGIMALLPTRDAAALADPRLERDLVALTNVDRSSNGLSALLESDGLIDLARERSDDMLTRGYFGHEIPPNGELVFALMQRRGIDYRAAGENLASNNAGQSATVQRAQQDFMNSPLHRGNILSREFSVIGVGAIPSSAKTMYTVLFMGTWDDGLGSTASETGRGLAAGDDVASLALGG